LMSRAGVPADHCYFSGAHRCGRQAFGPCRDQRCAEMGSK
jgi:hypothetical protein